MKYSFTFFVFVPKHFCSLLFYLFYYITTFIKTYDMRVFAKDGNCSDVTKPKNNSIYLFGLTMPFCLNLTIFFPRSLHLKIQKLRLMWHYHCSTHSSTYDRSNKREKCFNIVLFLFFFSSDLMRLFQMFKVRLVKKTCWESIYRIYVSTLTLSSCVSVNSNKACCAYLPSLRMIYIK